MYKNYFFLRLVQSYSHYTEEKNCTKIHQLGHKDFKVNLLDMPQSY